LTVRGIGPLLCQIGAERAKKNWRQRLASGGPDARIGLGSAGGGFTAVVRHIGGIEAEAASQAALETVSLFGGEAERFEVAVRVSPQLGLESPAGPCKADQTAGHVFALTQHLGTPLPLRRQAAHQLYLY
jgi:hypothetical protein